MTSDCQTAEAEVPIQSLREMLKENLEMAAASGPGEMETLS